MLSSALPLAVLAMLAAAQGDSYQHAQDMCQLRNDFNAPCTAVFNIMAECAAGDPQSKPMPNCDSQGNVECLYTFNNATQRACICGSQYFDQLKGCKACYFAHGIGQIEWEGSWPESPEAISSSYCAVKSEPTLGFFEVFARYGEGGDLSASPTFATDGNEPSPTWSDPINGKTDPALYFTPAVTGTDAYQVALYTVMPSPDWSSGSSIRISYSTSNGYYVPTATPNNKEAASGSPSASEGSGSAASGSSASPSAASSGKGTSKAGASSTNAGAQGSATQSGMAVQQTAAIAGVLAVGALAIML